MKSIYQLTALIGNKSDGINDEKFMTAAWILCLDAPGGHRLHSAPGASGDRK